MIEPILKQRVRTGGGGLLELLDVLMPNKKRSVPGTFGPSGFNGGTDGGGPDTPWLFPGSTALSDDTYATAIFGPVTIGTSNNLALRGLPGAPIPAGKTIDGFVVTIERHESGSAIQDFTVQLVVGGVGVGDNKAAAPEWPLADAVQSYGGAADKWGLAVTPAQANAADFGINIKVQNSFGGETAFIDAVFITVYYH